MKGLSTDSILEPHRARCLPFSALQPTKNGPACYSLVRVLGHTDSWFTVHARLDGMLGSIREQRVKSFPF